MTAKAGAMGQSAAFSEAIPGPHTLSPRGVLWLTGAGLSLIAVCYGLARFAYGLFVPVFRTEFDLTAATAGVIAAGSYIAYCVAILISTLLTARFGGRGVAVAAGLVATLGTLIVAVAPSATVLAAGVLLAGSSTGIASPPLAHAVAHTVHPARQHRTQTVINSGTGLGVALAGPVALATHEPWRVAWLVFAALCLAVTVWIGRCVPATPTLQRPRTATGGPRVLPDPLLPHGSARLMLAAAAMGVASAAVWTFSRDLLVTAGERGAAGERASLIAWIVLGAFGVAGAAAGDLARRWGLALAWTACMLTMAAATALLAALPGSALAVWPAAAVFGAAYIALTGLLLLWGTRVYRDTPAAGVGLAFLVIALGQAAGALAFGGVAEAAGPRVAFYAAAAVAVAGCLIRPRDAAAAALAG